MSPFNTSVADRPVRIIGHKTRSCVVAEAGNEKVTQKVNRESMKLLRESPLLDSHANGEALLYPGARTD